MRVCVCVCVRLCSARRKRTPAGYRLGIHRPASTADQSRRSSTTTTPRLCFTPAQGRMGVCTAFGSLTHTTISFSPAPLPFSNLLACVRVRVCACVRACVCVLLLTQAAVFTLHPPGNDAFARADTARPAQSRVTHSTGIAIHSIIKLDKHQAPIARTAGKRGGAERRARATAAREGATATGRQSRWQTRSALRSTHSVWRRECG